MRHQPDVSPFTDLLDPPENAYVRDRVGWVRDRVAVFLWSKQREILEAVVRHRYVVVKSAHDTARATARVSRCGVVARYEREDPFATTMPTTKQVHAILWRSSARLIAGAAFLAASRSMASSNRGPAERAQPVDHDQSAFQGIHALNPLMLVDRLAGVPKSIFDGVDALATSSNGRVLAIGNPDDPSSHFAQICKPRSGWHVVTDSAFDTPAYTGEEVPEDLLLLILPKWIEATQKRTLEHTRRPIIAANIARFGEDETVIMRREGGWIRVYRARHLCPLGVCA
jgi:hypothetical protein